MLQIDKELIEKYKDELRENEVIPEILSSGMESPAMNRHVDGVDFCNIGKNLQLKYPGQIDFRTQSEVVAGYWYWLRLALLQHESKISLTTLSVE